MESIRTGHEVTASCSIGDETVNGIPYKDIVEQARLYIHTIGGFEKFALWGLIRPKDE
jgi:S-adenosylmethionine synthetase